MARAAAQRCLTPRSRGAPPAGHQRRLTRTLCTLVALSCFQDSSATWLSLRRVRCFRSKRRSRPPLATLDETTREDAHAWAAYTTVMATFPHSPQSQIRRVAAMRIVPLSLILALFVPGLEPVDRLAIPLIGVAMGALAYYGVGFVLAIQDLNPLCPKWLLRGFCLLTFYFFGFGAVAAVLGTIVSAIAPDWLGVTAEALPRQLANGLASVPMGVGAAAGAHRAYTESFATVEPCD